MEQRCGLFLRERWAPPVLGGLLDELLLLGLLGDGGAISGGISIVETGLPMWSSELPLCRLLAAKLLVRFMGTSIGDDTPVFSSPARPRAGKQQRQGDEAVSDPLDEGGGFTPQRVQDVGSAFVAHRL